MKHIINVIILSVIFGGATFVYVENKLFKEDRSGISGYIYGAVLAIIVASIVAVAYAIAITRYNG